MKTIFFWMTLLSLPLLAEEIRIITIDGPVTETVFALGAGKHVMAVDDTSFYPPQVHKLPRVGYIRSLNAEGILALKPTMVLSSDGVQPPLVLRQLKQAGIEVLVFPSAPGLENTRKRINRIAKQLGKKEAGKKILRDINASLQKLQKKLKSLTNKKPRVMFILNMQGDEAMVAGKDTRPHWMIRYCGGDPVAGFKSWKVINNEASLEMNPDLILCMKSHGRSADTVKEIYDHKTLSQTKAVKQRQVHALDYAYYFHMGPRVAQAAWDLAKLFYPQDFK